MTIFDISYFFSAGLICALVLCLPVTGHGQPTSENDKFETLGKQYIEEFPAFSPVKATYLGDHRYDDQLDDVGEQARQRKLHWFVKIEEALKAIDRSKLSRENQVDYALMKHSVESQKWEQQTLQEWAWNPLEYTEITGSAVYSLMARDFAPVSERLHNVGKRLQQFPRFLSQVRETLDPKRVPAVHAKTALAQNRGVLKSIENFVVPQLDQLPDIERRELLNAIELATSAVHKHQEWLEKELLPNAKGNYQLGVELYEQKLKYSLHSPLRRPEIRQRSESFMEELHEQMYEIAKTI
ncbi:MAG: DUF885 family protein, partial [Planctomycetaceae bacterium]|nr:DUF885 family protein [Planctomycetaceae bacterium]